MAHSLRHRLGHPVETTLELFGGKWRSGLLDNLKERLLQHEEIRKVIWRWSGEGRAEPPPSPKSARVSEIELQVPLNAGGDGARPSPEAGHVMQLYVVGHGIAAGAGEGISDEWRPLTDKGRRRFQKTARAFGKLGRKLDLILTSPHVSAVQTAEILAGETEHGEVGILPELDPKFDAAAVRAAIAMRAGEAEAVAVVGHQSQLSSVLAALSGVAQEEIDLEEGTIVRVDASTLTNGASAEPRWWLKPKGSRKKGLPLRKQAAEQGAEGVEAEAEPKRKAKKGRRGKQRLADATLPAEPLVEDDKADAGS
jgi:phosphohistidine phosphatase SixA